MDCLLLQKRHNLCHLQQLQRRIVEKRKESVKQQRKKATASNRLRPCSAENCPNTACISGVCRRHGAKVKLCSVDSCSNPAKNGGVCFRHRKVVPSSVE